jgi:hypothetical protein
MENLEQAATFLRLSVLKHDQGTERESVEVIWGNNKCSTVYSISVHQQLCVFYKNGVFPLILSFNDFKKYLLPVS